MISIPRWCLPSNSSAKASPIGSWLISELLVELLFGNLDTKKLGKPAHDRAPLFGSLQDHGYGIRQALPVHRLKFKPFAAGLGKRHQISDSPPRRRGAKTQALFAEKYLRIAYSLYVSNNCNSQ
jgi:hypothetical protein